MKKNDCFGDFIYIVHASVLWHFYNKMGVYWNMSRGGCSAQMQKVFDDANITLGAAVAEWLSSWLAEQEDRGSIPDLATWIFRDWLSPASKSRYGWKIAKSTLILKTTNQPNITLRFQDNKQNFRGIVTWHKYTIMLIRYDNRRAKRAGNFWNAHTKILIMQKILKC